MRTTSLNLLAAALGAALLLPPDTVLAARPPNLFIVFADDLGYGDLGCYGHPSIRTPNLDRMAAEGMRFTDFYSTAEVCTPSRAALLTGRYPIRNGMCHDRFRVLRRNSAGGLPASEITLPERLKTRGYATACIGKWHLGNYAHLPAHHPRKHGFDFYFGLPHSNDMDATATAPRGAPRRLDQQPDWWATPLYRNTDLVDPRPDQTLLTRRYTEEAVQFIRTHKAEPFFLYIPHTFPHVPLFASDTFSGKSRRGLYGDVVEELDWSVGQVLEALRREGIADQTLVFFTSDNGPWLTQGEAGGSAGLLREGKGSTWEGGMRVPGIAWWPGRVQPGTVNTGLACTMDLFTTYLKLAGADVPTDRPIDGLDMAPLLFGTGPSLRESFGYYRGAQLYALRQGPFKAHFTTRSAYGSDPPEPHDPPLLFHLGHDPSEQFNVAAAHPEVLATIAEAVQTHQASLTPAPSQLEAILRPNVVFILADDLGYGDVQCLNPAGKIPTPHMDRLAAAGMVFTDAHSTSSVCTPTRYSILTGRYNWRSRLKRGVLGGMSPPLIEPDRLTVAAFLQQQGYHTACIGKWHLGMGWTLKPAAAGYDDTIENGAEGWRVDFTQPIANGPSQVGFDYFFGISASLDMVPYTYIENDRVTAIPTTDKAFPMMLGRAGGMTRKGPGAADFDAADVLPTLTQKAVAYIRQRAPEAQAGRPFFLYLPLASPHTPIVPTAEWQGRSGLNPYADFVMQTDASVGAVLDALDQHALAPHTLVIFTSDNGCSPQAKFDELAVHGHHPSHVFRGAKADIFEGGHRIPFLVRWPDKVKAGTTSDQLICQMDLFATCADLLGLRLPASAAEDSLSFLPALLGQTDRPRRETLVHHSINGSFAIRQGHWKLALCPDSGGWSAPRPGTAQAKESPPIQLYDMSTDIGERTNLHAAHPAVVAHLSQLLDRCRSHDRTAPLP
ncbi:MAG: hypothetical protein FJ387_22945 [Verrucomicrobia bacterium]|nr:hypothetical protein [Verrucomicrobiota bacterium]